WSVEIIISLLRIIYSCLTSPPCNDGDKVQFQLNTQTQSSVEEVIQSSAPGPSSLKFGCQQGGRSLIKRSAQKQLLSRAFKKKKFIHEFNISTVIDEELLLQISSENFVHLLMNLVADLASDKISYLYGGSFVRIHGIDYCFKIMFALMTSVKNFGQILLRLSTLKNWLDRTLLDCCDALIRREIGNNLYKLCRKKDDELSLTRTFIVELLSILEKAVNIPPSSNI
uniref:Uncharacterized protein n=1 Tax=Romanomermis culicivorax TaxID=13658 RepID=A0A915I7B6_ROMCU